VGHGPTALLFPWLGLAAWRLGGLADGRRGLGGWSYPGQEARETQMNDDQRQAVKFRTEGGGGCSELGGTGDGGGEGEESYSTYSTGQDSTPYGISVQ
jgi:hypothetical protein